MKLTVDLALSPAELAASFCDLNDEEQAQFFIDVARIAQGWKGVYRSMQWFSVGRHLRDCSCSTYEARDMVKEIAGGLDDAKTDT